MNMTFESLFRYKKVSSNYTVARSCKDLKNCDCVHASGPGFRKH